MKKKLKVVKKNVGTPVPKEKAPVTHERVQTSLILTRQLHLQAKTRSRELGISYNGLINLAVAQFLNYGVLPPSVEQTVLSRPPRFRRERGGVSGDTLYSGDTRDDGTTPKLPYREIKRIWDIQEANPDLTDYDELASLAKTKVAHVLLAEEAQHDTGYQLWLQKEREATHD